MTNKKRIKQIEESLNEYMEEIENPFCPFDLSIDLIQNHMEWLLNQVKSNLKQEVYILHIEDIDNVDNYYYTFKTQEEAWDFAIADAMDISGLSEEELLKNSEKNVWLKVEAKYDYQYSIIHSTVEQ